MLATNYYSQRTSTDMGSTIIGFEQKDTKAVATATAGRVLASLVFLAELACGYSELPGPTPTTEAGGTGEGTGGPEGTVTLAAAGDWDDNWGAGGITQRNLARAAEHDAIALLGDLSYGRTGKGIANAQAWCGLANEAVGGTPMFFVPGDHDSIAQDGDVMTYANCLAPAAGVVSTPSGGDYGMYPFVYYVDIVRGGTGVRVVGSALGYQESESEAAEAQKYFGSYAEGSENYTWLSNTYAEAKELGYWLIHINHLPCIDMGKNEIFRDCSAIIDLDVDAGVDVLMDGSSHAIWRTKQLSTGPECEKVTLTGSAGGANPACAKDHPESVYKAGEGLINAHAGTGGKISTGEDGFCDPVLDNEVEHYAKPETCFSARVPGFVSMKMTSSRLEAEFVAGIGLGVPNYRFVIER